MRKFLTFISLSLLILSLSACSVNEQNTSERFKIAIDQAASDQINRVSNHSSKYFDYYLPITLGRKTSTDTSVVINASHTEILLTLDIVNVVLNSNLATTDSLRAIFKSSEALVNIEGKTMDAGGFDQSYKAQLFDLKDNSYLLVIQTQSALVSAKVESGLVEELAYRMLKLARSVLIDRPLILAAYSNAETFSYTKVNLNMFAQVAPESGTVVDMITGDQSNLLDEDFFQTINDSPTEEEILQD